MTLSETCNVLWHESCKCICKLNSSVCSNKQIWNSDTFRFDCNEDFAGIINCTKGYMWNPSACECQCDTWCKPGIYLDHKNCICKNKLIGRVIEECISVINETMINNKDNITKDNTYLILFIVFLIGFIAFLIGSIYIIGVVMLIKKIKRFHLSKSRNFDLLNCKNSLQIIKKDNKYYPEIYLDEALYVQYI